MTFNMTLPYPNCTPFNEFTKKKKKKLNRYRNCSKILTRNVYSKTELLQACQNLFLDSIVSWRFSLDNPHQSVTKNNNNYLLIL